MYFCKTWDKLGRLNIQDIFGVKNVMIVLVLKQLTYQVVHQKSIVSHFIS